MDHGDIKRQADAALREWDAGGNAHDGCGHVIYASDIVKLWLRRLLERLIEVEGELDNVRLEADEEDELREADG